jgi:hypothetical protein
MIKGEINYRTNNHVKKLKSYNAQNRFVSLILSGSET